MVEFYLNHDPDDVLYALRNPAHYGLTAEQETELAGLVFRAIREHQTQLAIDQAI